jgi:Zn-dependent protease with chaperone function
MFYALCIALCLAALFLVVTGTNMLCMGSWWLLRPLFRRVGPQASANLMFTIRALPLVLGVLVTFGFVLPAFLKFEPRSTGELMNRPLFVLAALGALMLLVMGIRGLRLVWATMLAQREWRMASRELHIQGIDAPVYRVAGSSALLAVSGVLRPKIFIGTEVVDSLTPHELSAALTHEMAHVRALDNLKQFLLRVTRLPLWTDVDWTNVSEIAADEAALTQGASVLDLSAALIKVGRLSHARPTREAIVASHLLPVATGSSMEIRVTHLQKLLEGKCHPHHDAGSAGRKYYRILPILLLVVSYGACVNAALPWIHEAIEFLVR